MTMARYQFTAVDEAGNVIPGAHVEVRREIAGQPLAPLKSNRDGTTPLANPFDADADGFAYFHAASGTYQVRVYTGSSGAPTFERIWRYVEVGPTLQYLPWIDVTDFGAVDGGLTDNSQAFLDAFASSAALGKKVILVPGDSTTDYLIYDPVLMDALSDFTLVGYGANITYPGALCAISARSSVRCTIEGLSVLTTESARIVDGRSDVGNTSSLLIHRCKLQHINIGSVATRIGVDLDNNETATITNSTISVAAGIEIQGVSDVGHFSIGAKIDSCVFPNQTALHHGKASGNTWLWSRNEMELCLGSSIEKGPTGTSHEVTLLTNWMGDSPGVTITWPLVTSNSGVLNSICNIYASSVGGGGSSTCIQQDNSTGTVISSGDWLEADVGLALGTGNYFLIEAPNPNHLPTTLYTGTPASASPVQVVGGPANFLGRLQALGSIDLLGGSFPDRIQASSNSASSLMAVGQSTTRYAMFRWFYNATPASAIATLSTAGNSNALQIDALEVLIQANSGLATTIYNGGAAPTGTLAYVRANAPTLVAPVLGTPASVNLANATNLPVGSISGAGTGVLTALSVNVGSAGAPVVNGGVLGTPASGNGSNITNVNAATLNSATMAAPGAIGGGTPAAITSTTLTVNTSLAVTGTNATTRNQNGASSVSISNTDGGNAADARFSASNGAGNAIAFGISGSGRTNYGDALTAGDPFIYGSRRFAIVSDSAEIDIVSMGNTRKARFANGLSVGSGAIDAGAGNILAAGGITATGALAAKKGAVAVANGLNSNISTPVSSSIRLTGPSAVFSIGGFTGGVDGYLLIVYCTVAFAMTIVNEDASSTAGNRIKTLTGANVTLRAGTSICEFHYDTTDARWVLNSTN